MVNYTEQDLLRAIGKVEAVHACAHVLAKAFEILNDPDSNQMDLVEAIRTDSAITADILRISNSAFYGGHAEVCSLEEAINRLGFREVMKLVSISMSKQMFNQALEHYGISAMDFWMESAAVAATMENFADLLDDDRSYYFTLGILHCIGRLVINQTLRDRNSDIHWDRSMPVNEWEARNFGFDYTDSGHVLLTSWNFPQKILAVILNQITPECMHNPPSALHCLNYSIRWCASHRQFRKPYDDSPVMESWLEALEVNPSDLMDVHSKSEETFHDLKLMAGV